MRWNLRSTIVACATLAALSLSSKFARAETCSNYPASMCVVVSPTQFDNADYLQITGNDTWENYSGEIVQLLCPVPTNGSDGFDSVGIWFWSNGETVPMGCGAHGASVTAEMVDVATNGTSSVSGNPYCDEAGTNGAASLTIPSTDTVYSSDGFNYVLISLGYNNSPGANPYNVLYGYNVCLG